MKRYIDLDQIYNPESFSTVRTLERPPIFQRSRKPFEKLASCFGEVEDVLANKIENACRKILMMSKAGIRAINCEEEIMLGQDREFPALMWDDEIELLYHLEALILFGKSALDMLAYVFSTFLLGRRIDSFNKFCKYLSQASSSSLLRLKEAIKANESIDTSWLNILRGSEKGRSLRDKIAHQTIVKIEYDRIKPENEDLHCHVVVRNKTMPLEKFVEAVTEGVIDFCILAEDIVLSSQ